MHRFVTVILLGLLPGCFYQDRRKVRHDLNATAVDLIPLPGKYNAPQRVELKIGSSKLSNNAILIEVEKGDGSWEGYNGPIQMDITKTLLYRLVYVSNMYLEGEERTAFYEIAP